MKDVLVLLGGNKLNYGVFDKYHRLGFKVCVVDWNEEPFIKGDKHYQIDVKDSERIMYELGKDGILENVYLAYTSIDKAVKTAADINASTGCKTLSESALKNVSSKSSMTDIWNKKGILNRFSKAYNSFSNDIININRVYDLIFKPDDSASSRGITVVECGSNEIDLRNAYKKAKDEASNGIVIVEECVKGTEYTVELLGDENDNVSVMAISEKVHTNHAGSNRISVKLHYNCASDEVCRSIVKAAMDCYSSLELSCTMGHLELIVTEDGKVSPIEIAARSSGFIASSLVDIVSGEDYIEKLHSVMHGERIKNGLVPQTNKSSVFYFYDFPQGKKILKECNLLDFMDDCIVSLYHDRSRIKVGNEFEMIKSDNDRHGYEILEGPRNVLTPKYLRDCEEVFLEKVGML